MNNMSWPPKVSELNPGKVIISNLRQHFLSCFLHGSASGSAMDLQVGKQAQ